MNSISIGAPPPLPPRLSTSSSSCERHPDLPVTGFCASCLRERLQVLDPNLHRPPPHHPSSSSALRRCKSFSFTREPPPSSSSHEPHRRSCDVRSRSTLSSLFHLHPEHVAPTTHPPEITPLPPGPEPETRPMKEHINLDAQARRPGSFWLAASVFSKKLQSWRKKQKAKKQNHHQQPSSSNPTKQKTSRSRSLHEWQSEDARRSCDTDPRFSLDAGRLSLDCPSSFELPRASWDGHLLVGRPPPVAAAAAFTPRLDGGLIPVEEDPGGAAQTREYYADTSQRRRRSLDRSGSVRKAPAADPEEPRANSNARVSNYECYFWDSSFDYRECPPKKSKPPGRWSRAWSLWGLLPRRESAKNGVVERSMSESWTGSRRSNGVAVADGRQAIRGSNNAASSSGGGNGGGGSGGRHSFSGIGGMGMASARRGGGGGGWEWNGQVRKRREELPVLERNRSARYSPGRLDNGMLRFYLTPMRGSGSRRAATAGRINGSNSVTRSVLRLY